MLSNYSWMIGDSSSISRTSPFSNINLKEYASIKSGNYRKLTKAYYAKQKADKVKDGNSSQDNRFSATETEKNSKLVKTSADALKASAKELHNESLWNKKTVKTKDEKTGSMTSEEEYDWEKISKSVQSFVKNYNDTMENAKKSSNYSINRSASMITQAAKANSNNLAKAGITLGKDNKLSLDTNKLKNTDVSDLKKLFTGYSSFGSQVASRASSLSSNAGRTNNLYTRKGTALGNVAGSEFDMLF